MGSKKPTNCSECAYVQKDADQLWCPFHDLPVSKTVVCDDFLNEFDSPQWNSLMGDILENQQPVQSVSASVKIKDYIAYGLTGILLLVGFAVLFICLWKGAF